MKRIAIFLLVLTCLSVTVEAAKQEFSCLKVSVSADGVRGSASRFQATQVIDINVDVTLKTDRDGFPGVQLVRFRFITPSGYLYQEQLVPVSLDPTAEGTKVFVPGYPNPVPVQILVRKGGAAPGDVRVRFPVAGTSIVNSSLYGKWTVMANAYTDPKTCSATFTIEP